MGESADADDAKDNSEKRRDEEEAEEEKPPPPPPARMGQCKLCSNPAKYRCPGCAVATCSLECSRAHKTAPGGGCSGKRDRTAFKDIREFTDTDVVSDYRFLEEALLEKDRAKRWRPQYGMGTSAAARSDRPPAAAKVIALLTQQAQARGVELFCMPDGMARRVCNTTFYDRRRDLFQWRVEWLFHASSITGQGVVENGDGSCAGSGDGGGSSRKTHSIMAPKPVARAEDAKVDETTTVLAALQKHLAQGPGRAARLHELRRFTAALKSLLTAAESDGGGGGGGGGDGSKSELAVFLEKEGCPANAKRFYKLRLEDTLRANLEGKQLLEFPTLHVALLPEDASAFPEPNA